MKILAGATASVAVVAAAQASAQIPRDPIPLQLASEPDPYASQRCFVEVVTERETWYLGEPVPIHIRVGIEQGFQNDLLPLFRRELSLQVQVLAPWLNDIPVDPTPTSISPAAVSLALNAQVARAQQSPQRNVNGRKYLVFEFTRVLLPDRTGVHELSGTALRLAYATEFKQQLFEQRAPSNPRVAVIHAADLTLRMDAPPEQGRPFEFAGAIGNFEVRAELDRDVLRVGESLRLSMRIQGSGNLGHFAAPRLPRMEQFTLRALSEETSAASHTIHWDLAARTPGPGDIPPIVLSFLEPGPPARYRTLATRALHIDVLPGVTVSPTPSVPVASNRTGAAQPSAATSATRTLLVGTVSVSALLALAWTASRRRRASGTGTALAGPDDAPATFRAHVRQPDADVGSLMCDYLAARLDCSPAAIVGPDLTPRLVAAQVPAALCSRTTDCLERWIATRFGGPAPAGGPSAAITLVEELERAFRAPMPSQRS